MEQSRLRHLVHDRLVMTVILFNTLLSFLDGFRELNQRFGEWIFWADYLCVLYFLAEMSIKISLLGWRTFWQSGWNRLDLIVVLLSTPTLLAPWLPDGAAHVLNIFLLFRLARLLRYLRLLTFIPDHQHLVGGIVRSAKASVGVLLVVVLYNVILALGSVYLFQDVCPEHFDNPLLALYSIFRVFTVEGWYEIPERIAEQAGTWMGFLARGYFVFTVLTGGIIGLSLANAVFVDQMTVDNLDDTEALLRDMRRELEETRTEQAQRQQALLETLVRLEEEIRRLRENRPA